MLPSQSNRRTAAATTAAAAASAEDCQGGESPSKPQVPEGSGGMCLRRSSSRRSSKNSSLGSDDEEASCQSRSSPERPHASAESPPRSPSGPSNGPLHAQVEDASSSPASLCVARRYEAELDERRRTRGHSHPSVAETLNALGLVHQHMRTDPESALRCHGEALRILRRALLSRASASASTRSGALSPNGESVQSQSIYAQRRCRSSANGEWPTDDDLRFDVAVTLSDMGDAYWKMGSYSDASAAYGSALEAFANAGKGDDHPRVVSTERRLARLGRGVRL